jgi:ComF family protein
MRTPSWLAGGIDGPRLRPPGQCAVCRSRNLQAVCAPCVAQFAPAVPRCARCGLRVGVAVPVCGACLADPPPFDACVVACHYAFPWDRVISGFKFNARLEWGAILARLLARAGRRSGRDRPAFVVPVPLAPGRLAERGYNQSWELASRLARSVGCQADAQWLRRPVDGAHQARLTLAQRLDNVRGAFVVSTSRRHLLRDRHVAVVDDVMTSGATLREAASALRRAGAARVDAWVLERTPAPSD